jgi:hypothetical protein
MTTYYPPGYVYGHCPACQAPLTPETPIQIIARQVICNKPACRQWGRENLLNPSAAAKARERIA